MTIKELGFLQNALLLIYANLAYENRCKTERQYRATAEFMGPLIQNTFKLQSTANPMPDTYYGHLPLQNQL